MQGLTSTGPLTENHQTLENTFRMIGANTADDVMKEDLLLDHGKDMGLAKEAGFESEDNDVGKRRLILEI